MICHAHDTIKDEKVWKEFMSVFGKQDATDAEIEIARRILKDCGSYDYAIEMADRYTSEAIACLDCLKDSDDKQFMIELARFAMARDV